MCQALTVAAALLLAASDDGCRPRIADAASEPARVMLFAGGDLGYANSFLHGGLLWSPGGLSDAGFTFKMLAGAGSYRYAAGIRDSVTVTGDVTLAAFMPGWRFRFGTLEVTGFAGLDLQQHAQSPADPLARLSGAQAGLRAGADLWFEPLPQRLMLAASVSVSTIGTGYWARVAAGTRLLDRMWIGPEALAMGDPTDQQYRAGLHLTGLVAGGFEWSAGAGWAVDSDGGSGGYGRLGVLMRR